MEVPPFLRDHPRSRGENTGLRGEVAHMRGSSPLTRGKLSMAFRLGGVGRLIPAHAGKTRLRSLLVPQMRAHPRSRGENERDPYSDETLSGSSPLTRGKQADGEAVNDAVRLIPAHAGKTRPRTAC